MSASSCVLCASAPGGHPTKRLAALCRCGYALHYHTLGHPHGFTGGTPGCGGFQERQALSHAPALAAAQLPLLRAYPGGVDA